MKKTDYLLTKSKFLHGLQCDRLLWYQIHTPMALPEIDNGTQAIFDQGKQVGELAKSLYPTGLLIDWDKLGWDSALELSRKILEKRKPVFEPGFQYQNLFARADILNPVSGNKWDLIEVKSSTRVKEEHLYDLAFQKYVYVNSGLNIRYCFLIYINSDYTRLGDIDPGELFIKEDVSERVYELIPEVTKSIKEQIRLINLESCPGLDESNHCATPKSCPIPAICWSFLPERNIFQLHSGGKKCQALYKNGIYKLKDIPSDFSLNDKQRIQVKVEKENRPHLNKPLIREFLDRFEYPLYFLDFETISTAIPLFDLSSPYENIPFQYSLHIHREPTSKLEHLYFLSDNQLDPRPALLRQLKDTLGDKGSIIAYNDSFEKGVLKNCAQRFPQYQSWVDEILPRMVDLLIPFKGFHYYHPNQNGSASLKNVLPVLTGKTYDNLEINEGGQASQEFLKMAFADISPKERSEIRKHLKIYCKQDTQAMVDIIHKLDKFTAS